MFQYAPKSGTITRLISYFYLQFEGFLQDYYFYLTYSGLSSSQYQQMHGWGSLGLESLKNGLNVCKGTSTQFTVWHQLEKVGGVGQGDFQRWAARKIFWFCTIVTWWTVQIFKNYQVLQSLAEHRQVLFQQDPTGLLQGCPTGQHKHL